jgi:hypothetical protein
VRSVTALPRPASPKKVGSARSGAHLRVGEDSKPPATLPAASAFVQAVGSPTNLKLALSVARLVADKVPPNSPWWTAHGASVGLWLGAAPVLDPFNADELLTVHGALATLSTEQAAVTASLLRAAGERSRVVSDASLARGNLGDANDEEFGEVAALAAMLSE